MLLRLLVVLAWAGLGVALFALLERISLRSPMVGDDANLALQGWDMLHGNLLLHGWILGDVTYYTFELPLYAIAESLIGLRTADVHVVGALTYLIVAAFAVALARTGSRGLAAAARSGVVIAVLAASLVLAPGVSRLLEVPDRFGTSVFFLGSFLLIDKAAGRRFTAPLACVILCVILCAGQIGDATVRYVAVPAILAVCAYRVVAARKLRTYDMSVAVAAAGSVPLSLLTRAVMRHFGSYAMIPPETGIAPIGQWAHHAARTVANVMELFGLAPDQPHTTLKAAASVFVPACVLAAAAGFVRAAWTWRIASRAEQMLCITIVVALVAFTVSRYAFVYEISVVLPCGAVLAARACVPGRIASPRRASLAFTAATLAAVLPLAAAASVPPAIQEQASITAWLDAHGFRYGLAFYWDASTVTVQSGGRVQVRAVEWPGRMHPYPFGANYAEEKPDWYDPLLHRATFVIAGQVAVRYNTSAIEQFFGRPAAIYHVAGWVIVSYRKNLLERVATIPQAPSNDRPAVG